MEDQKRVILHVEYEVEFMTILKTFHSLIQCHFIKYKSKKHSDIYKLGKSND